MAELRERLGEVFQKIESAGLKLKAEKCNLFHRKLKYLGHIVSEEGVECDPEMIQPVKEWKVLGCQKELQSFLGFGNFYRRFIKGFANIAEPLTSLLGRNVKKSRSRRDKKPWIWGDSQQTAFDKLKEVLTSPSILAYPNFKEIHS